MDARWSDGVVFGLPVAGILIAGALSVAVLGWRRMRGRASYEYQRDEGHAMMVGGGIVGIVALALALVAMFPYDRAYHEWQPVAGTVATVDVRILDADGGTAYDIRFAGATDGGVGSDYVCQDTRCATIAPGDLVTLACKLWYERTAADWWECRYVGEG
jgi:hypothetical protein